MRRCLALAIALLTPPSFSYSPQTSATSGAMLKTPTGAEILEYGVEWRFVRAGVAQMKHMRRPTGAGSQTDLHVQAGGIGAKPLKVNDDYSTIARSPYRNAITFLRAQAGSRTRE